MTDTKNPGDKTLHVPSKTLSLKRPVEQGVVRQSFSHGRSKAVVVEKVKRRVVGPETGKPEAPVAAAPQRTEAPRPAAPAPAPGRVAPPPPPTGRPAGSPASGRPQSAARCTRLRTWR